MPTEKDPPFGSRGFADDPHHPDRYTLFNGVRMTNREADKLRESWPPRIAPPPVRTPGFVRGDWHKAFAFLPTRVGERWIWLRGYERQHIAHLFGFVTLRRMPGEQP